MMWERNYNGVKFSMNLPDDPEERRRALQLAGPQILGMLQDLMDIETNYPDMTPAERHQRVRKLEQLIRDTF